MKKKFPLDITMKTTALVTTIAMIGIGLYDLTVVQIADNVSISVSRFLINSYFEVPAFSIAFGYVLGHLTGYAKPIRVIPCKAVDCRLIEKK